MPDDEQLGHPEATAGQAEPCRDLRAQVPGPGDREFRKMWLGESVSVAGDQISLFALPSLAILTLHASGQQVGYLNAITTAAFPACGIFFGAIMERTRCRRLMIGADLIRLMVFAATPPGLADPP
jgi:MFS family permease